MPLIEYEKDLITKFLLGSFFFLGLLRQAYPVKFRSLAYVFISGYQLLKLNEIHRRKNQDKPFYILFTLFSIALFSGLAYLMLTNFKVNLSISNNKLLLGVFLGFLGIALYKYLWSNLFQSLSKQREELTNYRIHKWIYIFATAIVGLLILSLYNYSDFPKSLLLRFAFFTLLGMLILGQGLPLLLFLKKAGLTAGIFTFLFNDIAPYGTLFLLFYYLM